MGEMITPNKWFLPNTSNIWHALSYAPDIQNLYNIPCQFTFLIKLAPSVIFWTENAGGEAGWDFFLRAFL